MKTEFAPAFRRDREQIVQQTREIETLCAMNPFLNAIPDVLLVLNKERQTVYANQRLLDLFGHETVDSLLGMRPGELFNCQHAFQSEGGCGTTLFCSTCGVAKAILNSQKGAVDIQECQIVQNETGNSLDLRVRATPIYFKNSIYTIFVVSDISHEKRRRVLERIFFHDVLNTAGGLRGFAELLRELYPDDEMQLAETVYYISESIIDEIQAQKQLMAAENNELRVNTVDFRCEEAVNEIVSFYKKHMVAEDKRIEIADPLESDIISTDRTLLRRVLGNMLKNALEATRAGGEVQIGVDVQAERVVYWVKNAAVIPAEAQLQIFKRSYSTKGLGRGLGTHSMKLIAERYLKGSVSFSSKEEEGTVFTIAIPKRMR